MYKTQAAWWHARASFRIASHAAAATVVKRLYGFDKNVSTMVLLHDSMTKMYFKVWKESQRRRASGAAEARQRRRDKHRRWVRRATKRSMWRELWCQAPAHRAMWACCSYSSSDDDDHNSSSTLLLLFADAFVAPALLAQTGRNTCTCTTTLCMSLNFEHTRKSNRSKTNSAATKIEFESAH